MKNPFILLFLLFITVAIYGQNNYSRIEDEIRGLEKKENIAMLNHDTTTLKKIWSPDFTVNTPFNRVTVNSKELLDMVNNGTIRFSTFTRSIEQIMIKKDIAITFGSEEVVFVGNVPRAGQTIKRRYTNIWIKQNGVWKLTSRHANDICP